MNAKRQLCLKRGHNWESNEELLRDGIKKKCRNCKKKVYSNKR